MTSPRPTSGFGGIFGPGYPGAGATLAAGEARQCSRRGTDPKNALRHVLPVFRVWLCFTERAGTTLTRSSAQVKDG